MGLLQSLNCFYSKEEAFTDCNQMKCNVKFMGRTRSHFGLGDVCRLCIEASSISKMKLKNKERYLFEIQDDHFVIEGKRGIRKLALSSVTIIKSINSDRTFLVIIQDKDSTFHVETYSSTEKAKMNKICDFFKTHQSGVFSEICTNNMGTNNNEVESAMEFTKSSDNPPISKPKDDDHSCEAISTNCDDQSFASTDVNAEVIANSNNLDDAADCDDMAKVKGVSGLIAVLHSTDAIPVDTSFSSDIKEIIDAIGDDNIAADIQNSVLLPDESSALCDPENIADDDLFGKIKEELENWASNLISTPNLGTPEPPVKHVEFADEDDVLSCSFSFEILSSSDAYYALSSSDDSLGSIWHLFGADLLYSSYEEEDSDSVADENDYEEGESDYSPSEMEDTWSTSSSEYSLDDYGRLTRSESAPVVIKTDADSLSSYEWEHTQSC